MNNTLSKLGQFGCPYHGLIKDGLLTLPNADTLTCRQPSGLAFERGHTHLIDLPDAPGAVRTLEQQTADIDQGKQWLSQAIIAGDQIHGTEIGNAGMIYVAPDSSKWLVNTNLHSGSAAATSVTVTLRRFGLFGVAAEEHSYTVAVPDLTAQCTFHSKQPSEVLVRMFHAHPQGQAAVFGLFAQISTYTEFAALAWIELSLSGPADACVISVALIRDAATTAGTLTRSDNFNSIAQSSRYIIATDVETDTTVNTFPDCSGSYRREISYTLSTVNAGGTLIETLSGSPTPGEQIAIRTQEGVIVGLRYGEDGIIRQVTVDVSLVRTINAGAISLSTNTSYIRAYDVVSGAGVCEQVITQEQRGRATAQQSATFENVATIVVRFDGAEITRQVMSDTKSGTSTFTYVRGLEGEGETRQGTRSSTYACVPGGTGTYNAPPSAGFTGLVVNTGGVVIDQRIYALEVRSNGWWFNADRTITDGSPAQDQQSLRFLRLSNGLFGFVVIRRDLGAGQYQYIHLPEVGNPDGPVTLDQLTTLGNSQWSPFSIAHGSYNPITGQSARALTPVCWT